MIYKILIIIFITFSSHSSELKLGIELFQKNKLESSLSELRKVSPKTPGFKRSLEVQSVIYYKQERYQKLLATAIFYRKHFLKSPSFNTKILGLELLTLNKLCQYNAVTKVLHSVESSSSIDLTEMKKTLEIGRSFSITTELSMENKYHKKDLWKIDHDQILKLTNPYNLVIKLENLCES
ncbi:hypothetical protein [Halobacteriovorax sp.]|uniref:hypothetical protein n=1 Tax=Halobacteriovorax sp. TaxID=2020862 RepID=UPI00356777C7